LYEASRCERGRDHIGKEVMVRKYGLIQGVCCKYGLTNRNRGHGCKTPHCSCVAPALGNQRMLQRRGGANANINKRSNSGLTFGGNNSDMVKTRNEKKQEIRNWKTKILDKTKKSLQNRKLAN